LHFLFESERILYFINLNVNRNLQYIFIIYKNIDKTKKMSIILV